MKKSFGKRLKFLREVKGLTQSELAARVGVTEQYQSMMERGLSSPSFDVISRLCQHLDATPASLFLPTLNEPPRRDGGPEAPGLDWQRFMSRIGVFEHHLQTDAMHWSDSLFELFGLAPGSRQPGVALFMERVSPGDRHQMATVLDRLAAGLEAGFFQFRFERPDGSLGTAVGQAEVDSDTYGVPVLVRGVVLDVSERRRMEEMLLKDQENLERQVRERTARLGRTVRRLEAQAEERRRMQAALAESRESLRALLDATPDLVYLTDAQGVLQAVNRAAAEDWGRNQADLVGANRFDMLDPELAASRWERFQQARDARSQVRYRDVRDGRIFESRVLPTRAAGGEVTGFAVYARDVTRDEQDAERLRTSEATLAAVLSSAPVGIGLVGPDRILSLVNERLGSMLGRDPDGLRGQSTRLFYESDAEYGRVGDVLYGTTPQATPASVETRLVRADGTMLDALVSTARLDPADVSAGLVFTVLDITERNRLESLREDADRVIRHDLRQPVQSAMAVCRLLAETGNLDEGQMHLVRRLESASKRMLDLLNLSLDLHRLELGVYPLESEEVDLAGLCREVVDEAAHLNGRPAEHLKLLLCGEPCGNGDALIVHGDPRLLRSVVENLVQNALEADAGGPVTLSLDPGAEVVVSVHNNGAVPHALREAFFDKYATAGKTSGTGLGTYAARLIAELHGGRTELDTSSASGTTVRVRLPGLPVQAA